MSRVAHLLNATVNVWRYTEVSDGMGGDELRRPGHEPLTVDAVYVPSAPVYKRAECTADQVPA
ncbi:hypothetical protein [Streptomyces sp. enrichment culture]|uniref:hypothetical protein n=1 Tax=Streptomyces sp. enrichment culture TaxID=1795815 RepID=UPI003F555A21